MRPGAGAGGRKSLCLPAEGARLIVRGLTPSVVSQTEGLAGPGHGDVVGDVAGARAGVRPPATRPGPAVLAEAAGVGRPAVELGPDRHLIALHVILVRDRDPGHARVDGGGELAGGRVVADDLKPADLIPGEVELGALLQEEPAGQRLEGEPPGDVVLLGVQRAAGHVPGADESLQALERGIGPGRLHCLRVLVLCHDDLLVLAFSRFLATSGSAGRPAGALSRYPCLGDALLLLPSL